jgi:hypothetical protein
VHTEASQHMVCFQRYKKPAGGPASTRNAASTWTECMWDSDIVLRSKHVDDTNLSMSAGQLSACMSYGHAACMWQFRMRPGLLL